MFTVVNGGEHTYKRTHVENTAASKACPELFFYIIAIIIHLLRERDTCQKFKGGP